MKRKASELEECNSWTSWSPSSDTSFASEGVSNQQTVRAAPWPTGHNQRLTGNDYMNLRTRKRIRDNRPDEQTIHQSTLAKLFNAQCQPDIAKIHDKDISVVPEIDSRPYSTPHPERAQQSLHSFFAIRQKQAPVMNATIQLPESDTSSCEDCGNRLLQNQDCLVMDTMDYGMDADDEYACANCRRRVCDICAVRGNCRICLECAMPGGG